MLTIRKTTEQLGGGTLFLMLNAPGCHTRFKGLKSVEGSNIRVHSGGLPSDRNHLGVFPVEVAGNR